MKLLIFGYGYVAQHLVALIEKEQAFEHWSYFCTKRSAALGCIAYDDLVVIPSDTTHVLITMPPNEEGDIVYKDFKHQVAKLPKLQWLGYISSTSVYGDRKGDWVSEEDAVQPTRQAGRNRVLAENQWLHTHLPVHIFRMSAIYGPGRNQIAKVAAGDAKIVEADAHFFSRMHVDDIAQTLLLSMKHPKPYEVYNLADDMPSSQADLLRYIAQKLDVSTPDSIPIDMLPDSVRNFYMENRRVLNNKIKQQLGVMLQYPSYKEGIDSLF